MLQWLITQKTEDRIELITRQMLETMVEETQYLAVYFCKLQTQISKTLFHYFTQYQLLSPGTTTTALRRTTLHHQHQPNPIKKNQIYPSKRSSVPAERKGKPPAYCRSFCSPSSLKESNLTSTSKHSSSQFVQSYMSRKRKRIEKQGIPCVQIATPNLSIYLSIYRFACRQL